MYVCIYHKVSKDSPRKLAPAAWMGESPARFASRNRGLSEGPIFKCELRILERFLGIDIDIWVYYSVPIDILCQYTFLWVSSS